MNQIHSLLKRQLKKHIVNIESIPKAWQEFINAINDAYHQSDIDRDMLERSLDLSSQELLQANAEMRVIFQALPDLFFRFDSTGKILDCKGGRAADLYLQPEKLIGKKIQDIPIKDVSDKLQKAILFLRETRSLVSLEYSLRMNEKEYFYEARLLPLFDDQIIMIIRNITERKKAEEALRESEKRFRDVVMSTSDWIWEIDIQGRYTYCSERVAQVLGYTAEELIGKTPFDLMSPEEVSRVEYIFKKILNDRAPIVDFENWNIDREGRLVCLLTNGVPMYDKENNLTGYRGVDKNITERKQREEEIKRNTKVLAKAYRKLQKANQELKNTQDQLVQAGKLAAIGQLAAGVSHELNNPLGGILGYAQFILDIAQKNGVENISPEKLKNIFTYIGYIEKESQRCKTIVANLLKFSRASKTDVTLLDINRVLENTFVFTRHQLEMKQVEIIPELTPKLPQVKGNEHQLQQVFTNLMVNAQQAMPQGGKLTVRTGTNNGFVQITFTDTGCGIAQEHLDKLFDPFFTTKAPGDGTGLGLSVSYGIIQDHKGKIKVESAPGKGTSFYIKLPVESS
jgi:PAS domain S-box-containing protein